MKILYTTTSYLPAIGGAQVHLYMLVNQLKERHSIRVLTQWDSNRTDWLLGTTLRAPREPSTYIIDGIEVFKIGLTLEEKVHIAPYIFAYYPMMHLALPKISPVFEQHLLPAAQEANLVHNIRIGREILSYASLRIARRLGIPFVLTPLHHSRWKGWRYHAFENLYRSADLIFALTNSEKSTLTRLGVKEERISVTGIGPVLADQAFPEIFQEIHNIDGPMVLFLGQHYPYKGYRQVLQAANLVWKQLPNTHFVFIGPAVRQSEKVFKANKDRRIHRLGTVDLQVKTNALALCTLLCVPSTQESFGGVYTEAWSFAKPVIGCNIPTVSEVINNGVDGYLVSQEPKEIADRISHLLQNPATAQIMGVAGQCKLKARYTWKKISDNTEEAYKNILH